MSTISFLVPVKARGAKTVTHAERRGRAIMLQVGNARVRFVLQVDDSGRARDLTHWASGMRVGGLDSIKVQFMCARGHHARLTSRAAAALLLARIVDREGVDKVRATLAAAPVINR